MQPYERMNLADALAPKHYSDGEQIIRQGDTADGMYFVEDGVVRITILGDNGREVEVHFFLCYLTLVPFFPFSFRVCIRNGFDPKQTSNVKIARCVELIQYLQYLLID